MDGEVCSITDITTPSNGSFPLILANYINKRLIIISSTYSLTYHTLQSPPYGITYISDDKPTGEIAVTLPVEDSVVFLTVGNKMCSSTRKAIAMKNPSAIRYHRPDNMMIVITHTPEQQTRFQCWSVKGELVRTIASVNYYIDRMNLTTVGRIIFTSFKNHCLCLLDMSGKVLKSFHYIDDNMKGPYGLASDKKQSIYVCGLKCLRVVSEEGKWGTILRSDDGHAPQSLHVCNKTDRLFVGQAQRQKCNYLLIFQL